MMKKNESEKLDLHKKKKNKKVFCSSDHHQQEKKKIINRFLISVNVVGSAGPLRFVVNENESVANVIDTCLKTYSREGRLPVLGFHVHHFLLYCANSGSDALNPMDAIGTRGARNFVLCKKQNQEPMSEARSEIITHKATGWKAWLHKSFNFKSKISLLGKEFEYDYPCTFVCLTRRC